MSAMLINRDGFVMPADGWYQLAPIGEFPHGGAGVVQVLDAAACEAMVNRFREEAKAPNFAGLLVDFDHFSLDGEKKTEAAGWVVGLEYRGPTTLETGNSAGGGNHETHESDEKGAADVGLWGKIRWSDVGEAAVKGGRYRHLSPAWSRADCEDLGNGRVRPLRLKNAAVTNDPNMRGMVPLSNRGGDGGRGGGPDGGDPEERFEWVVGANDRHCPSCAGLAGQVHTLAEWDAAGVRPGHKGLYCQGNCHCDLQGTTKESSGAVVLGPMRRKTTEGNVENSDRSPAIGGGDGELSRKAGKPEGESEERVVTGGAGGDLSPEAGTLEATFANIGWRDEARAASLAVRQAGGKEERRKREAAAYKAKHGREPANDEEWAEAAVLERDARMKGALGGVVKNVWSDAARAASLAVRQAKAKARREAAGTMTEAERSAAMARGKAEFVKLYGEDPATDEDFARVEILAGLAEEDRAGGAPVPAADAKEDDGGFHVDPTGVLRKVKKEKPVDDGSADAAGVDLGEEDDPGTLEEVAADALSRFEEEGFNALTAAEGDALMAAIQAKIARGEELTEAEQGFLEMDAAVSSEGGVVANAWEDEARAASLAVRRHKASMRLLAMRDAGAAAFRAKYGKEPFSDTDWEEVEDLGGVPREFREYGRGPAAPVPGTEKKKDGKKGKGGHFLAGSDVYVIDKDDGVYDEPGLPDPVVAAVDAELDAYFGDDVVGNTWSDEAREASIRVRQAKARARKERRERLFTKDIGRPPTDSLLDRFALQTYEFAPDELVDGERVEETPDYLKAAMDEEKRIVQEGRRADFVMEKRTELAAAYKERVGRYPVTADDWAAAGVLCGMRRDLAVSFGTGAKIPKAKEDPPSASLLDEKWTEAMAMGMDGIAGGKYASGRGGKKGKEARARVRDSVSDEEMAMRAEKTPHGTRDPRMAGIGVDSGATVGVPTGEGSVVIGDELPAGELDRREKASRDAFGISYFELMIKRDALEEHKRLEAIGPMGQEFLDTARIIEGGVPESMVPVVAPAKPRAFPLFASVNDNPVKPTGPRTEEERLAAIAWEADKKARRAAALEAERRWNAGLSNSWSDQARAAALAVRRAKAGARGAAITPGGGQSGGSVPWFDPATGQYVMAVPAYAAGALGLPGAPAPIAVAPVGAVPGAPVVPAPVAAVPVEARPEAPVTGTVGGVKPRPLPKPVMPGPGRPKVGKPVVPRKS